MLHELSNRIKALEHTVVLGQYARSDVSELQGSITELETKLNAAQAQVREGERAQRILDYLAEQTEKVLAGGELVRGTDSDLPPAATIAAALDDSAATIHATLEVVQNNSELNSEPIQNEVQADTDPTPLTEAPITEQTPTDTTETVLSDTANLGINSRELPNNSDVSTTVDTQASEAATAPYITQEVRFGQWLETLPPDLEFDCWYAQREVHFPIGSVKKYLAHFWKIGQLERVDEGGSNRPARYRRTGFAAPEASAATSPQQPAEPAPEQPEGQDTNQVTAEPAQPDHNPPPQPKTAEPIQVSALMKEELYNTIRSYGQPLAGSALAGRLKKSGFDLARVQATAAQLIVESKLKRLKDGRYALYTWGGA